MWQQQMQWTEAWTLLDCVHVRMCLSVLVVSTGRVDTAAVDNCTDVRMRDPFPRTKSRAFLKRGIAIFLNRNRFS